MLLQVFMGVLAGTGLPLAAAMAEQRTGEQRRAAVHGVGEVLARGSIRAESAGMGHGSTFTIDLPRRAAIPTDSG
jgi:hypothetical protein